MKALYPGTFDPVHYGHIDIATRAACLFDYVIVGVYDHDRPLKSLLFSTAERVSLLREAFKDYPNIGVQTYSGLTVYFARQQGLGVIVRGLRASYDFELEYQMALTNSKLAPDVETICLMTTLEHAFVSSSIVKQIALAGGPTEGLVPAHVREAFRQKLTPQE